MSTLLVLIAIASALLHAMWNTLFKRAGGEAAVLWLAQLVAMGLVLPVAVWRLGSDGLPLSALPILVLSGVSQGVYFWLLGKAYEHGDISVVYPIARGGGVAIAAVIAALWLDERLPRPAAIGVAAVCLGTVLVGLSSGHSSRMKSSLGWALGVAANLGSGAAIDKLAVQRLDPTVYFVCLFAVSAVLGAPNVLFRRREKLRLALREQKAVALAIGVGSMASYLLILYAYQQGPLTYLLAFRESAVLFGTALGVLLLKENAPPRKLVGIGVIVAGLVCLKLG